jgi:hypothetical protein
MACRDDIKIAILNEVDKEINTLFTVEIKGRHTYYRVNQDTFRIANKAETRGKSKADTLEQAGQIARTLQKRLIEKYGNNLYVTVVMPQYVGLPVEVKVSPKEHYVEKLFAQVDQEKRTESISRLAFLQDPALFQQELIEDQGLKMVPYEAWLTQQRQNKPITEVKPGVQELFDENPELAAIGTPEQYSQYLNTIFLESKIEYRGDSPNLVEFFYSEPSEAKKKQGIAHKIGPGVYTSPDITKAEGFAKDNKGQVYTVLVNTENSLVFEDQLDFLAAIADYYNLGNAIPSPEIRDEFVRAQASLGKSITILEFNETASPVKNTVALGTKQDIEGFKEFVKTEGQLSLIQLLENPITQVPDVMATMIYQNENCK